jgi:hypothetical protein
MYHVKSAAFVFGPQNNDAINLVSKMLMECEDIIDEFCGHFPILNDRVKRLSPTEIKSTAMTLFHAFGQ